MEYVSWYDVLSIKLSPIITIYCIILALVFGVVMGSALNCLAWRIANNEKWSGGHSHCPSCNHELSALELIPVISWLIQKGKCRHCGTSISKRYLITELLLALIYVSILLRYDLSLTTIQYVLLSSCLFTLSLVDLDTMEIPNRFLIIPALFRILFQAIQGGISAVWASVWHGLIIGFSLLVLSLIMDKAFGKESIGGGDIKLFAMLGLYFSLPECVFLLILSCIVGLIFTLIINAKRGIAFPFGPAISVAAWIVIIIGSPVTQWYLSLF